MLPDHIVPIPPPPRYGPGHRQKTVLSKAGGDKHLPADDRKILAGLGGQVGLAVPGPGPYNPDLMDDTARTYMHWAKTHSRVKYELTASGAPPAQLADFGGSVAAVDLREEGTYGHPALIEALAELRKVDPDRVLPVTGASTGNFIALACAAARGDTVLVERPVYEPLAEAARFLGLRPLPFSRHPQAGFRPALEEIAHGLAGGARCVVLTNLHNPSGRICPDQDLEALARLAGEHDAWLIVDEVYLDYACLNRDRPRRSAAELGDHVVVTDSLTKVYGLGGLRAGWIIAAPAFCRRAERVVDLLHVVNPVVSARVALQAVHNIASLAERCRRVYQRCRPVFSEWLASRPDLAGYGDDGALFAWVRLPPGLDAGRLAALLAARYETGITPGTFFGDAGHIRLGLILEPDLLREGLSRVGRALDELAAG